MAGLFNCGFARVAARNSVYDENGKVIYDKGTRLQRFLSTFSENKEAFAVCQNTFDKRLPVLPARRKQDKIFGPLQFIHMEISISS